MRCHGEGKVGGDARAFLRGGLIGRESDSGPSMAVWGSSSGGRFRDCSMLVHWKQCLVVRRGKMKDLI